MSTFGNRLRELRQSKKMTQKDLAARFGLSESAIGMYERDEREPSLDLLKAFAKLFDVSIDRLIGYKKADENLKNEEDEFLEWIRTNLGDVFFFDFDSAPEARKELLMRDLWYMWEREKNNK